MSDESKLVLFVAVIVMAVIVVAVFLTALLVVAWKNAEPKRIEGLVDRAILEKLSKSRYTVEIIFFDRNETKLTLGCVCAHRIAEGVLSVVQTNRHITYVLMDNVEFVRALPAPLPAPTLTKEIKKEDNAYAVD